MAETEPIERLCCANQDDGKGGKCSLCERGHGWRCERCGSFAVEESAWIMINTGEVMSSGADGGPCSDYYCDGCEQLVRGIEFVEKPTGAGPDQPEEVEKRLAALVEFGRAVVALLDGEYLYSVATQEHADQLARVALAHGVMLDRHDADGFRALHAAPGILPEEPVTPPPVAASDQQPESSPPPLQR